MTNTDLANMALSRLGEPRISDIAENTPAAISCRENLELVRDSLLRSHPWNFAMARAELSQGETPVFGWEYSYALPADILRLMTFNGVQASMCAADFTIEAGYLLTDVEEAKVTYVRRVVDPTLFDPLFVEVLVFRLAAGIAMDVTATQEKRDAMEALAAQRLSGASFVDAGERRVQVVDGLEQARYTRFGAPWERTVILGGGVDSEGGDMTGAEILAELITVDGAGSGLDADLLDGQHASAFATAANLTSHTSATTGAHGMTAFGASLVDDADAAAARTTLGLGTAATSASSAFEASGAVTTHAAVTSGVHGISAFGATLVDDADASAARTTLGLVIGTNVQAYDAELAAIAGLTSAADKLPYFTGGGTAGLADLTSAGRALIDDADASAQRTTLGLGTAATTAATAYATAAQGTKADTAVQPNTSPTFSSLTVNGGGNALNVTGNIAGSGFSSYPYFAIGYPNGDSLRLRNVFIIAWDSTGDYSSNSADAGFARSSAGLVEINNGTAGTFRDLKLRNLTASGGVITPATFTVGTLPTASSYTYGGAIVTDANGPTLGATVASGGSAKVAVRSNGTNWIVTEIL